VSDGAPHTRDVRATSLRALRASSIRQRRQPMLCVLCIVCLCVASIAACAPAPSDETPMGALRMFLRAMENAASDATALGQAFELLDAGARAALEQRARDASALANGREFAPWEMLAQGRYRVRFAYAEYGSMRERVDGDSATVTVVGTDGRSRANVPLVREAGHWRVVLVIPTPPPHEDTRTAPPPAPML